jgi:hypothetical protein
MDDVNPAFPSGNKNLTRVGVIEASDHLTLIIVGILSCRGFDSRLAGFLWAVANSDLLPHHRKNIHTHAQGQFPAPFICFCMRNKVAENDCIAAQFHKVVSAMA